MQDRTAALNEVAEAINNGDAHSSQFNLEAIVDDLYAFDPVYGYVTSADEDRFWSSVERHAY